MGGVGKVWEVSFGDVGGGLWDIFGRFLDGYWMVFSLGKVVEVKNVRNL